MRLLSLQGRQKSVNAFRYKIDWDGPSASKPQRNVKKFLKKFWIADMVVEEFPVIGTLMRCDIINFSKMICIEVDGDQHEEFNKHFHKTKGNWIRSLKRDVAKERWLDLNKIKVIRIYARETEDLSAKFFREKFDVML